MPTIVGLVGFGIGVIAGIVTVLFIQGIKQEESKTVNETNEGQELLDQAWQNFNYADNDHIDKAVKELNSAEDQMTQMLAWQRNIQSKFMRKN